jgi:hypothetical protein
MAVVSLPFGARAQVSTAAKPVQFGIAAGGAIPTSNLSDIANAGVNGTVTLGFNPAMIPLGIRIDGAYNHFGRKSGGDVHVTSLTGNLAYRIPGATLSPYAIGGAGWYGALLGSSLGFPASPETTSAGTSVEESRCRSVGSTPSSKLGTIRYRAMAGL